jgi:hypothetical protein
VALAPLSTREWRLGNQGHPEITFGNRYKFFLSASSSLTRSANSSSVVLFILIVKKCPHFVHWNSRGSCR